MKATLKVMKFGEHKEMKLCISGSGNRELDHPVSRAILQEKAESFSTVISSEFFFYC